MNLFSYRSSRFQTLNLDMPYPAHDRNGIIVIGNFDGVHRGHKAVLTKAIALATQRQPVIALSFEPHPRSVFQPHKPVFRLSPALEKSVILSAIGLNGIITIPFSKSFASKTAQEFIDDILLDHIGAQRVVIGHDFHFGKNRMGTPQFLQQQGQEKGFNVSIIKPITMPDGLAISSTRIRKHLMAGAIDKANHQLGHHWFVMGPVVHGAKRGRELGFPTANMQLHSDCQLRHGIYAVTIRRSSGALYHGVASYGRRPQFDNGPTLLETHVFEFSGDLYGQSLAIFFHAFLRAEKKFQTTRGLIEQMHDDCDKAIDVLSRSTPLSKLDEQLAF